MQRILLLPLITLLHISCTGQKNSLKEPFIGRWVAEEKEPWNKPLYTEIEEQNDTVFIYFRILVGGGIKNIIKLPATIDADSLKIYPEATSIQTTRKKLNEIKKYHITLSDDAQVLLINEDRYIKDNFYSANLQGKWELQAIAFGSAPSLPGYNWNPKEDFCGLEIGKMNTYKTYHQKEIKGNTHAFKSKGVFLLDKEKNTLEALNQYDISTAEVLLNGKPNKDGCIGYFTCSPAFLDFLDIPYIIETKKNELVFKRKESEGYMRWTFKKVKEFKVPF